MNAFISLLSRFFLKFETSRKGEGRGGLRSVYVCVCVWGGLLYSKSLRELKFETPVADFIEPQSSSVKDYNVMQKIAVLWMLCDQLHALIQS